MNIHIDEEMFEGDRDADYRKSPTINSDTTNDKDKNGKEMIYSQHS